MIGVQTICKTLSFRPCLFWDNQESYGKPMHIKQSALIPVLDALLQEKVALVHSNLIL